jgi:hypothetical protein
VEAVDGDCVGRQAFGEDEAGGDLGELALAVGTGAAVVVFEHHVVEVDRMLADRGDVDDASRW